MKTIQMFFLGLITLTGVTISKPASAQPGFRADVSFNSFYNELSPYGRWTDMPRYGKVWFYNEPGFRPYYSNGQWIDTDMGSSWESGYDWGWAPFHYGRWEMDPQFGWFWIPGYEYAPAWVAWSRADDYYGWAPLGFGIDINISIGNIPSNRWMYAPVGHIGYRNIDRYCIPYQRNDVYYRRQQPVVNIQVYKNVRYGGGPRGYQRSDTRGDYGRNENRNNNLRRGYGNSGNESGSRDNDRNYNNNADNRNTPRNYNGSGNNRRPETQGRNIENRREVAAPRPAENRRENAAPQRERISVPANTERRLNESRVITDNRSQNNNSRVQHDVRSQRRVAKAETSGR